MRAVHARETASVARLKIRNIQTWRPAAFVASNERDARSIRRHARIPRGMRHVADTRRRSEAGRTRSKPIAQLDRGVTFGRDPVAPLPRQALAAEQLPHALAAGHDRSKAAGALRHPRRRRVYAVAGGEMIEKEAAEHVVAVEG